MTDSTEWVWRLQFESARELLSPYVITIDGEHYLDPDTTPKALADMFSALTSVGYARGWL